MSNERLEFLGDAVLGLVVADALYAKYPREPEGLLSPRRARSISRDALAQTARQLGVGALLRLGKGEAAAHGESRPKILAAAMEAVIGAVYLAEGFEAARRFVLRVHAVDAAAKHDQARDSRTELQELAQAQFKKAPSYSVTGESGPPHARTFNASVRLGSEVVGTGSGPTKKAAQAEAAAQALRALRAAKRR